MAHHHHHFHHSHSLIQSPVSSSNSTNSTSHHQHHLSHHNTPPPPPLAPFTSPLTSSSSIGSPTVHTPPPILPLSSHSQYHPLASFHHSPMLHHQHSLGGHHSSSFDRDDEMGPPGSLYYFTSTGPACIPSSSFSQQTNNSTNTSGLTGANIVDRISNISSSHHYHHTGHRGSSSSSHLFDHPMSSTTASTSTPCVNTADRIGPTSGSLHHRRESFLYRGETNDAYEASPKSISRHSSIGSGDL